MTAEGNNLPCQEQMGVKGQQFASAWSMAVFWEQIRCHIKLANTARNHCLVSEVNKISLLIKQAMWKHDLMPWIYFGMFQWEWVSKQWSLLQSLEFLQQLLAQLSS